MSSEKKRQEKQHREKIVKERKRPMFKMAHEFVSRRPSVASCMSSESKQTHTTAATKASFGHKKNSKIIKLNHRKHLNAESLQSYGQTRRRSAQKPKVKSPKEKVKIKSPRSKMFKSFHNNSKKDLAFGSFVMKTEESEEVSQA
jgi:hypothetical protein